MRSQAFEPLLSQTKDLNNGCLSLSSLALGINRIEQGLVNSLSALTRSGTKLSISDT